MLQMLRDLVAHKGHANAALLNAIRKNPADFASRSKQASPRLMQVCMHSHGRRAQCAKLLRRHGGVPPQSDFILWLTCLTREEWN